MYSVQKKAVRHEVRSMIKNGATDSELVHFTFALKDTVHAMEWKHSREFKYRKTMYDIVHREYKGDSVLYKCWKDTKETELSKRYNALFKDAFNKNQPLNKSKTHFFCTADKWNNYQALLPVHEYFPAFKKKQYYFLCLYTSPNAEVNAPPPQFPDFINS